MPPRLHVHGRLRKQQHHCAVHVQAPQLTQAWQHPKHAKRTNAPRTACRQRGSTSSLHAAIPAVFGRRSPIGRRPGGRLTCSHCCPAAGPRRQQRTHPRRPGRCCWSYRRRPGPRPNGGQADHQGKGERQHVARVLRVLPKAALLPLTRSACFRCCVRPTVFGSRRAAPGLPFPPDSACLLSLRMAPPSRTRRSCCAC